MRVPSGEGDDSESKDLPHSSRYPFRRPTLQFPIFSCWRATTNDHHKQNMAAAVTTANDEKAREIEFASDLSRAEIEDFRSRILCVPQDAKPSEISTAFRKKNVAFTFENANALQQAVGLNLHKCSDSEWLIDSVISDKIASDLVSFAMTRLAFLKQPAAFRSAKDLQAVHQYLATDRPTPRREADAKQCITRALSELANAASSPEQRVLPEYFRDSFWRYQFHQTFAPRLLEDACCTYARKRHSDDTSKSKYYSRYFAIVQSSGVGKSRALHELRRNSERVFVVYVNLRQKDNVGEPSRTPVAANFIEENVTNATDWDTFLHAMTYQLNVRFARRGGIPNTGKSRDDFHNDLLKEDSLFWTDVVGMFRDVQSQLMSGKDWDDIRNEVFKTRASRLGVVNHLENSKTVLVVALDECVDALVRKNSNKFYGMQKALVYGEPKLCDVVAVVVDTNSTICNFAPPDARHPAGRVVAGSRLHSPFVFFDVDVSKKLIANAAETTRQAFWAHRVDTTLTPLPVDVDGDGAALTVRRNPLVELLYCRPLFSTPLFNLLEKKGVVYARDFCYALLDSKLPRVSVVGPNATDLQSIANATAAAISCASLRWDVTTHSATLTQLLVSQRLALIRKVAPRMTRVWCQYSFEPALSRHVAEQMLCDKKVFEAALATLSEVQVGGYLEMKEGRGNAGEMAATIVLCRAIDMAQPPASSTIAPVWLHSWLAQLFPQIAANQQWRQIFRQSAARRGVVHFHSARRLEEPLSRDVLLRYLQCGVAIISPRDEPATDIYVPVAYPKQQNNVDLMDSESFTLGVVTIQVKNVASDRNATQLLQDMFTFAKDLLGAEPPLVGVVLQMNPTLKGPDAIEKVSQGQTTRRCQAKNGLGLVKYFANGFPCLSQSPTAHGIIQSLFEYTPIDSQVVTMLREIHEEQPAKVAGDNRSTSDNNFRNMAALIGSRMFHARSRGFDDVAVEENIQRCWYPPSGPPPVSGCKRKIDDEEDENDTDTVADNINEYDDDDVEVVTMGRSSAGQSSKRLKK